MSADIHDELRDAVTAMCQAAERRDQDRSPMGGGMDTGLWADLSDAGLTLLDVPEEAGGSGGDTSDFAVVLDVVAQHRSRVPVADSGFLAAWILAEVGLEIPAPSPIAVAARPLVLEPGDEVAPAAVEAPWASHASHLVVPVQQGDKLSIALLPLGAEGPEVVPGANLAGEPRDTVVLDTRRLDDLAGSVVPAGSLTLRRIEERGALARSVQLAGAATAVLDMCLRHASERVQFGRPLSRFQAVQQHLAELAGDVVEMRVAAAAVGQGMAAPHAGQGQAVSFAVAAAKATTSACAARVATLGHQIHGALGFSREHALGGATTRLWSWRDEFGDEFVWQDRLAASVLEHGAWWHALAR